MDYKYYNQFHLTGDLANSLSSIISQKEGVDYVCREIIVTIPEHKGLVFSSPLDNYNSWGGGLNALSGAQINAINKKYGKYIMDTIPKESYSFIVVMNNELIQSLLKNSFKNEEQIESVLNVLSVFYSKYNGTFDSRILSSKFPYLQEFFARLDEWCTKTGRVTLDSAILADTVKKTLVGDESKSL